MDEPLLQAGQLLAGIRIVTAVAADQGLHLGDVYRRESWAAACKGQAMVGQGLGAEWGLALGWAKDTNRFTSKHLFRGLTGRVQILSMLTRALGPPSWIFKHLTRQHDPAQNVLGSSCRTLSPSH